MSLSLTEKHICSSYQDGMLKSSMTQIQTLSPLQYIQALYNTYQRYSIKFVISFTHKLVSRIRIKSILSLSSLTSKKFTRFFMNNNM